MITFLRAFVRPVAEFRERSFSRGRMYWARWGYWERPLARADYSKMEIGASLHRGDSIVLETARNCTTSTLCHSNYRSNELTGPKQQKCPPPQPLGEITPPLGLTPTAWLASDSIQVLVKKHSSPKCRSPCANSRPHLSHGRRRLAGS